MMKKEIIIIALLVGWLLVFAFAVLLQLEHVGIAPGCSINRDSYGSEHIGAIRSHIISHDAIQGKSIEISISLPRLIFSEKLRSKRLSYFRYAALPIYPFPISTLCLVGFLQRLQHNSVHSCDYYVFMLRRLLC